MTTFATFIDSGNERAPIAARGKAKQKRYALRIVGLGLVATRDGVSRCSHGPIRATRSTSPSSPG